MMDHGDIVARARGLTGRLLTPEQISTLNSASIAQFAQRLTQYGAIADGGAPLRTAQDVEWAIRTQASRRMRILEHWCGTRRDALDVLFADEELRSLRTLMRAIIANVPPAQRMTGVIPTSTLPERSLQLLASVGDIGHFASLLVTWGNAYGPAVAVEAARPRPELLQLEVILAQVFAERAVQSSRHDRDLGLYASRVIDFANLWTMLVLADHHADLKLASLWIPGGAVITAEDMAFAAQSVQRVQVQVHLAARVDGTPLAATLAVRRHNDFEHVALQALFAEFRAIARREPTSIAPVIAFVLQQRLELITLTRIMWGIALGIPRRELSPALDGPVAAPHFAAGMPAGVS